MKLLVTGATGFLGRYIVAEAMRRGHEVRAQVRPASNVAGLNWDTHPRLEMVRADLRSKARLDELVTGVDLVIHAAADKTSDFYAQFAANVVGTENLLGAMERAGVNRLVHISTFSVYDYLKIPTGGVIDEDSPIDRDPEDRDDYAKTKLLQEHLVREHEQEYGLHVTYIRPGMLFGRGELFPARLGLDLSARTWVRIGGRTILPINSVETCADAIVLAAEKPESTGQTINLVDDNPPTHKRYIAALRPHLATKPRVIPVPWRVMAGLARCAWLFNKVCCGGGARVPGVFRPAALHARFKPNLYSNDRAGDVLNWRPRFDLAEALRRSVADTDPAGLQVDAQVSAENDTSQSAA
jgi:nucleoside-diphosphate-sugar epimerase